MIRDSLGVARLICGIWFGDLSRSVTGSRTLSQVLLAVTAVGVIAWQVIAVLTAGAGSVTIPEPVQLQILGEIIAGTALASGCTITVLLVLSPAPRELAAMLAATPLRPGSWMLGQLATPIAIATVFAPLVMSPVIASSVHLSGSRLGPALVAGAVLGSAAGAVILAALIKAAEALFCRLGIPRTIATSISAGIALAASAGVYARWSREEWVSALPLADAANKSWTAVALVVVVLGAAASALCVIARLAPPEHAAAVVRWFPTPSRTHLSSALADVVQSVRNPLFASTVTLMGIAVVATVLVTPPASPAWATVMFLLMVAVPSSVCLITYGTNRRALWLRTSIRRESSAMWGVIKLGTTAMLAGMLLLAVTGVGAALGHLAAVPWTTVLACTALASAACLLAGVHFPADLEMPGAPVIAFLEAAALTIAPLALASTFATDSARTIVLLVAAAIWTVAVPASVRIRRNRSITA